MVGKSISGGITLYLLGVAVFVIIYICILKKKKLTVYHKIIFMTLFIYLVLVVEKTLMPIPMNFTQIEMWRNAFPTIEVKNLYNLVPSFDLANDQFTRNTILNIIMFIPFGFLFPLCKGKIHLKYVLRSSLFFTLMIELYQLCTAFTMNAPFWYFDTNDIIANILGGVIGYIILKYVSPYLFKRISKKEIYGENYEKNS